CCRLMRVSLAADAQFRCLPTRRSSDLGSGGSVGSGGSGGSVGSGGSGGSVGSGGSGGSVGSGAGGSGSGGSGRIGSRIGSSGLRWEEDTSELQSRENLVCGVLLDK